jgi:hypothetical protein
MERAMIFLLKLNLTGVKKNSLEDPFVTQSNLYIFLHAGQCISIPK